MHRLRGRRWSMGEAKRSASALSKRLRIEADRWGSAETTYEREFAAEISSLPEIKVRRQPVAALLAHGMKPQECHLNCWSYIQLDPSKTSEMVVGWVEIAGNFVLHSVVKVSDGLTCITPPLIPDDGWLSFRQDPDIVMTVDEKTSKFKFERKGQILGYGIRPNPAKMQRLAAFVRRSLDEGMSPHELLAAMDEPSRWDHGSV